MRTKILLLSTIFFSAANSLMAQIAKGKYLLGGSFSISGSKRDDSSPDVKNESLTAAVQFGKVVRENTVVGVIVSYGYNNYNVYTIYEDTYDQYSAGMFYRKYTSVAKNIYVFGEGNVSYFHSATNLGFSQPNNYGSKTISNGASVYLIPGVAYSVGKKMQAELVMLNIIGATYSHSKVSYPTAPPSAITGYNAKSFSFNTNLNANLLSNFGIGFKFLLGK